jgi:hypothetical protein
MNRITSILTIIVALLLSACEDPISINLDQGQSQLCVDALISNEQGKKTIRLTQTNPYFDNNKAKGITDAAVLLINRSNGKTYNFIHQEDGNYVYEVNAGDDLGLIGDDFSLKITINNEEYQAFSKINPVPQIDSISYEFRKANGPSPEGYVASLYAIDIAGRADYYWIRTFRNDSFLNKPANINIACDAAFPPNGGSDGFLFIPPIREGITPFDRTYKLGEKVSVELCSITAETYEFLSQSQRQMENGGLFATPPFNVITNINNTTNPNKKAVGWFVISAISRKERIIQ